jgi:hypothetical protein
MVFCALKFSRVLLKDPNFHILDNYLANISKSYSLPSGISSRRYPMPSDKQPEAFGNNLGKWLKNGYSTRRLPLLRGVRHRVAKNI